MNILLAHHAPWVGGTRTHVISLAQQLVRRGHHVVLMTDGGMLQEEMAARGIPFAIRPADGLRQFYRDVIRQEGIQLLHAHTPITVVECSRIAAEAPLPWVATIHGEYTAGFDYSPNGVGMACNVGAVVAVSEWVKRYLITHSSVHPGRIHLIANGVDTDEYCPGDGHAAREELGLGPEEFVVMYLGRLESDKSPGVLATVRAVSLLRTWGVEARGIMVGGGSLWEEMQDFSRQSVTPGREAPLVLTGIRRDLPRLIAACDAMIASGRSALEGMAVGKPVVAIGRAGYFGLVVPERWESARESNFADHGTWPDPQPVEVARQLHRLCFDRSLASALGMKLRALVVRDHNISDTTGRILEVYHAAMGR